jgi:Zinc finger, C3HC4 type (RING finger)
MADDEQQQEQRGEQGARQIGPDEAVRQLRRHFGGRLDEGVLSAILEMFDGDVAQAQGFLEAEEGDDGAYDAHQLGGLEGGMPADYPPIVAQHDGPGGRKRGADGQGAVRGRFVGRGRGGRGYGGGGRPDPAVLAAEREAERDARRAWRESFPIQQRLKNLFLLEEGTLREHYELQQSHYVQYAAVLVFLLKSQAVISKASRPRILAGCWARKDRELPLFLLSDPCARESFQLLHVLGALKLLDTGRQLRSIDKQIRRLEQQGTAKPRTIKRLKERKKGFIEGNDPIGSISGALARHIREQWVAKVPEEELLFFALAMPTSPWEELIDLLHVKPTEFQLSWFADYVCGHEPPADSVLTRVQNALNGDIDANRAPHEQLCGLLTDGDLRLPYSYVRKVVKPPQLTEAAKVKIAQYETVDKLLWFHEELTCNAVDTIIAKRLQDGELPTFGYGKLMERLMYLMAEGKGAEDSDSEDGIVGSLLGFAESELQRIKLSLEGPVVVLGDASYSMDVAIRTATVIGSVLTALSNAELLFFTDTVVHPPVIPRTAAQVLEVASRVRADGLTAPAAALWPFYQKREVLKLIVVVTDEVENNKFCDPSGLQWYFPDLYEKYVNEVSPDCRIAFVSFLENASDRVGRMAAALEVKGHSPLVFKLDARRPDLTKLDQILAALQAETAFFPRCVAVACEEAFEAPSAAQGGKEENSSESAWGNSGRTGALAGTRVHIDALPREERRGVLNRVLASLDETISAETREMAAAHSAPQPGATRDQVADTPMLGAGPDANGADGQQADALSSPSGAARDCVICEERAADTVLLECAHAQFCKACADNIVVRNDPCPVCRQPVVRCVKMYQ